MRTNPRAEFILVSLNVGSVGFKAFKYGCYYENLFKSFLEWYTNILKDVEPKEAKHYY